MTINHSDDAETAAALSAIRAEVQEYIAELAALPANTLPADYDAVCLSEFTDALSSRASSCPRVSCLLGSFWESHHMLASCVPYERAVRVWFDWLDDCLAIEIKDHSEPTK